MKRNTDEKELDMEDGFALEGDFVLVKARGGTEFAESSNKTEGSTRRAGDNECLDTVEEMQSLDTRCPQRHGVLSR